MSPWLSDISPAATPLTLPVVFDRVPRMPGGTSIAPFTAT